ncbi:MULTISPECIES: TlpA disulfide reductase family protein [unclassified Parabacteroides]|uniref:peroxiredoxin family protein n=1 Tax=unclassified Parabacteroides TaxID=2649774 RepID=UPI0024758F0D|nr:MULTISPECIES: TlpA disulfide reductase family protein [unclassified Parabacteroides]
MRKIVYYICICLLCPVALFGQRITLDMPANAGIGMVLTLKQGLQRDTIYQGTFDQQGKAVVTLPDAYKSYQGMAELRLARQGAYFEFIVAGEDMTLYCADAYPQLETLVFKGSPENESLKRWFINQAVLQQKNGLLGEARKLYPSANRLTREMDKEIAVLEKEQGLLEDTLSHSTLYAARFMEMRKVLNTRIQPLIYGDSAMVASTRAYLRDSLDVNGLFTSGMWFDTLNGSLALYDSKAPYHAYFIDDMSQLLKRAGALAVYTTLAENLFAICETMSWNTQAEELARFLISDGRIQEPSGRLQMLMTLHKLGNGSQAPPLTQGKLPTGKVLLIFYESGCGPCENEMMMLAGNYKALTEKGYTIVSVSADTDEAIFHNTAESYPWQHKYCDGQGLGGADFHNYGVIGTPTFYVIGADGTIEGRYARLIDTGIL